MTVLTGVAVSRDGSNNGTLPKGHRLAIGGTLAKGGASGLDVRKGVLWDNGAPVVTGNAAMTYSIRSCNCVVMPSTTQGPVIVPNDASVTVATTAAPGSNSRIDVIWVRQHMTAADGGADTDVIGELGVTQGAVAASPTAPAIPTGAVELARATVTAGTTATNTLTISQTHLWTVTAGAPIPVRNDTERSALSAFDGMLVNNLTSDRLERYDGVSWTPVTGADSGWTVVTPASGVTVDGTRPASYRKIGNRVWLRGRVSKTGGFAAGDDCFTLPAGFRPAVDAVFPMSSGAGPSQANVLASGIVEMAAGALANSLSIFDSISFLVD